MKAFVERKLTRETQILLLLFCLITLLYTLSSVLYEIEFGLSPSVVLDTFAGSEILLEPALAWSEVLFHLHFRLFLEIIVLLLLFGVLAAIGASRASFYLFFACGLMLFAEILFTLGLRWQFLYLFAVLKQVLFFASRAILLWLSLGLAGSLRERSQRT